MELSHFEGYIHLFAAANLAWSGSETFRLFVEENVFNIRTDSQHMIDEKMEMLRTNNTIFLAEVDHFSPEIQDRAMELLSITKNIEANFKAQSETLKDWYDKSRNFPIGFKGMFLINGLYCIALLILAGFESSYPKTNIYSALQLMNLYFFFNLMVFIRSFTQNVDKVINASIPITVILIISITVWMFVGRNPFEFSPIIPEKTIVGITLFLVASPFVLHFIRAFILQSLYGWKLKRAYYSSTKEVKKHEEIISELSNSLYTKILRRR